MEYDKQPSQNTEVQALAVTETPLYEEISPSRPLLQLCGHLSRGWPPHLGTALLWSHLHIAQQPSTLDSTFMEQYQGTGTMLRSAHTTTAWPGHDLGVGVQKA